VVALEGSDGRPGPAALAAVTVNTYGVPLVRPVTVQVVALVVVHVRASGELVAV
jgi:hypothetical protein